MMFLDFNLLLLAGMSSDALGNWIFLGSILLVAIPLFLCFAFDWIGKKLDERREAAEEAKVKGQKNSKDRQQDSGEIGDEFRLKDYAEMTEVADSIQIFIARGDKPSGPYTPNQVNEYLKQGLLLPDDLASHEGMDEWIPLSQLIDNLKPQDFQQKLPPQVPPEDSYKTQQMGIKELIGENIPEATHMVLEHVRLKDFRWMAFIELPLFILLFILFLPCALILAIIFACIANDGEAGAEGFGAMVSLAFGKGVRFYKFKHQLILKVYGASDVVLAEAHHVPPSKEAAENLIFDLLESLHQQQLVLVEMLDTEQEKSKKNIKEHLVTWYGGRSLMALQKDFVEKDSREALLQKGWEINDISDGFSLSREVKADDGVTPIWGWLLLYVFFPPSLILLAFGSHREHIRECWFYGHEEKKPDWEFSVKADRLRLIKKRPRRNTPKLEEKVFFDIHGRDLIGISYAAGLGYDKEVTYQPKSVKIYTNQGIITLPKMIGVNFEHVCNWLIATSLRLRSERPELGLGFDPNRPTKCPYCASIYVFKPGQSCPSCGGWPERIN